jgi:hypothetical protein
MTFSERAAEEFKNGDIKKQKMILAALGHTHVVKDVVLRPQTKNHSMSGRKWLFS